MSDRDYIAWSLLAAGAFALLLAAFGRFSAKSLRPPWERRLDRLEFKLGDQLGLGHHAEAGKIEDAIARLDAFASRHPRLGSLLLVLDRAHLTAGVLGSGFVGVGLWAGKIGAGNAKVSAFVFLAPLFLLVGALIEAIPFYGEDARGLMVLIGLTAAFAIPLAVVIWTVP
ncbi:hypothetical protein [Sphingomonas pruni]|jgi:hypothetical protein|uniref:hypothetical protein n=1 Tax=Sphingomonas pruni TaxID=40683 RepID=UPI00082B370B|nr:hypothetical protein [Sphingomonas pruni]